MRHIRALIQGLHSLSATTVRVIHLARPSHVAFKIAVTKLARSVARVLVMLLIRFRRLEPQQSLELTLCSSPTSPTHPTAMPRTPTGTPFTATTVLSTTTRPGCPLVRTPAISISTSIQRLAPSRKGYGYGQGTMMPI